MNESPYRIDTQIWLHVKYVNAIVTRTLVVFSSKIPRGIVENELVRGQSSRGRNGELIGTRTIVVVARVEFQKSIGRYVSLNVGAEVVRKRARELALLAVQFVLDVRVEIVVRDARRHTLECLDRRAMILMMIRSGISRRRWMWW